MNITEKQYGLLGVFLAVLAMVVFLPNLQSAYAQSAESQLTVNSQLSNGTVIEGYFVEIIPSNGGPSVYTPATFTLTNDEIYHVGVADYLTFVFDHWLDTGSNERWRCITINTDTQIYAVYRDTTLDTEVSNIQASGNGLGRLELNALVEKISVFGGSDSLPVPTLNLSGYKLQSGSQIMEYDSMYELINSGLSLLDTMEVARAAGIEWDELTEAQQCYLLLVLNTDIYLDENGLPL
jgi:hypothetical protein